MLNDYLCIFLIKQWLFLNGSITAYYVLSHFLLPIVPMRKRENGAGVSRLLAQRGEHCEFGRAAQQLGGTLERYALHLQRSRIS